jgi:membrane-bound ClpP family serine protease
MTALGVSLLLVGAILILVEAHVPTLGVLGAPGVVALGAGAVIAVLGLGGGVVLGVVAALLLAGTAGGVLAVTVGKGVAVRRRRVRAGPESLVGHIGVVRNWAGATGTVQVDGTLWTARRSVLWDDDSDSDPDSASHSDSAAVLQAGDRVVVDHLDGLTVGVRRAEEWELTR